MAVRQQFLDKTNNGADQADPFASLVGGLPLPAFDSPVGDTNVDTSQQTQQQQQQQATQQAASNESTDPRQAITDPRVSTQPVGTAPTGTGATGVTHPTPTGRESVTVPAGDPSWSSARGSLGNLLGEGNTPQEAVAAVNQQFKLGTGAQAVYYPPGTHGPNDRGTIGLPEGYWALNEDGSWGWNPRTEGGAPPPTRNPGPTTTTTTTPGGGPQFLSPSTAVGSDPFSQQITGGLSDLISHGGMTPEEQSLYGTLSHIISSGGRLPNDQSIDQANLEKARENESNAFTSQLADTRDELAARGLVSEPGIGQGEEASAINRINRNIAPAYAQSVRDITTASAERQNARVASALTTITGLSEDASHNLLNSLGQGTQRQTALANIALQSLDQNIQWNEFLANYGLTRDQLLYQVQQGNIASIMPILALFSQLVGHTTGGFV